MQSSANGIPDRTPTARVIQGAAGIAWTVHEIPATRFRTHASLIFESPMMIRCVVEFPSDWRGLSDTELLALSARR